MFRSCQNKGFQITFDNGWTVSVQFGPGNYCEHHHSMGIMAYEAPQKTTLWEAMQAEIAAWNSRNQWLPFEYDTVAGYKSPAEVLAFINRVSALPADFDPGKPKSWADGETEETASV
jgi:hypothetical protein